MAGIGAGINGFVQGATDFAKLYMAIQQAQKQNQLTDAKLQGIENKRAAQKQMRGLFDPVEETKQVTNPGLFSEPKQGMSPDNREALNSVLGKGQQLDIPTKREPNKRDLYKRVSDIASQSSTVGDTAYNLATKSMEPGWKEKKDYETQLDLLKTRTEEAIKSQYGNNYSLKDIVTDSKGNMQAAVYNKQNGEVTLKDLGVKSGDFKNEQNKDSFEKMETEYRMLGDALDYYFKRAKSNTTDKNTIQIIEKFVNNGEKLSPDEWFLIDDKLKEILPEEEYNNYRDVLKARRLISAEMAEGVNQRLGDDEDNQGKTDDTNFWKNLNY